MTCTLEAAAPNLYTIPRKPLRSLLPQHQSPHRMQFLCLAQSFVPRAVFRMALHAEPLHCFREHARKAALPGATGSASAARLPSPRMVARPALCCHKLCDHADVEVWPVLRPSGDRDPGWPPRPTEVLPGGGPGRRLLAFWTGPAGFSKAVHRPGIPCRLAEAIQPTGGPDFKPENSQARLRMARRPAVRRRGLLFNYAPITEGSRADCVRPPLGRDPPLVR